MRPAQKTSLEKASNESPDPMAAFAGEADNKLAQDLMLLCSRIETKCLMTIFGIGKYSGGGMQFTNYQYTSNGLLDITVVKNMTFLNLLFNIHELYNEMLITHKEVSIFSSKEIKVVPNFSKRKTYIQADGEIIGTREVKVSIHKQAIQFVVP